MGSVLAFPARPTAHRGVLHVYAFGDGFEVGHESASGNSWGGHKQYDCAQKAVAAAYRMNRDIYGGCCTVDLHDDVLAALPDIAASDRRRGQ